MLYAHIDIKKKGTIEAIGQAVRNPWKTLGRAMSFVTGNKLKGDRSLPSDLTPVDGALGGGILGDDSLTDKEAGDAGASGGAIKHQPAGGGSDPDSATPPQSPQEPGIVNYSFTKFI